MSKGQGVTSREMQDRQVDKPMLTMPRSDFYGFFKHDYQKCVVKFSFYASLFSFAFGLTMGILHEEVTTWISQTYAHNWVLYPLTLMTVILAGLILYFIQKIKHRHH